MRHAKLAHRDFNFHSGVIDVAQYFNDFADRLGIARRLFGQFDADHLAGLGFAGRTGDQDVLADPLVFRRDNPGTVFIQQATDHVGIGARDDFDDRSFRATAFVGTDDACLHTVTVQYFVHLFFGQEQIVAAVIGDQKSIAVAVTADAAFYEIWLMGQLVIAGAVRLDLTVALHGIQAARQAVQFLRFDTE